MTGLLKLDKGTANLIKIYGGLGLTGDDLEVHANTVDALPKMKMHGNGAIEYYTAAASTVNFIMGASTALTIGFSTPDALVRTVANRNIALLPDGTGKVKFGTKTGTGDVAVDGYVSTLDSAGGAVKLATVA
jgi:hypothetical protein